MMDSIWEDIRYQFRVGNMVTRLIIINIAVFVLIGIVHLVFFLADGQQESQLYQTILHGLSLPSSPGRLLFQPWSIFTHMFLHEGFWHLLFNMLYLYWFGIILGDLIGDNKILPIYLFSGLIGAVLFLISAQIVYGTHVTYALGASAAVMGIATAAATVAPDYEIRLLLLGPVKLKYIVGILVILDLIAIPNLVNTGGHIAHVGGAFGGIIFINLLRRGIDLSALFKKPTSKPTPRRQPREAKVLKMQGRNQSPSQEPHSMSKADYEDKLNAILEKIKTHGHHSLTQAEKDFLDEASKRL